MFPSISAMSRGAPTFTAPPHQDRRRASKLLSRIREVVDNKGRYVCLSKVKEEICELASRIFPVQKLQHKVSLVQLLTYRWFLSTTSRFRDKIGTRSRDRRDRDDFRATDAMRPFSQRRRRRACPTQTRLPHQDAPATPLQEDWRARHGDLPSSRPLNWDCEKRARERPPAVRVRRGISPAW